MRRFPVFLLPAAAVVLLLLLSGCAGKLPAPPAESSAALSIETLPPAETTAPAPAPVSAFTYRPPPPRATVPPADLDRAFVDAAAACYRQTPVIADMTTHMAFLTCMQKAPTPAGTCARGYRDTIFHYMNEDDTTGGYARETHNTQLARDEFNRSMIYDTTSQQFVPCG